MAAFLSALSGAGQAAGEYGQQVRQHLEKRRGDFAELIGNAAQSELDPQTRASLQKHQADLLSGKPIGKIATDFQNTLQKRIADENALASVIGKPQQPEEPKPQAGPAQPGTVPGTPQIPPVQPAAPPAAQPAANPIQGGAQIQAPAPVTGLRPVSDLYHQFSSMPEFQTPAGRQALGPMMTATFQHNMALQQEQQLRQMDLNERQTALKELEASPEWAKLPDLMKSQYRLWAHSRTAAVPQISPAFMKPVNLPGVQPSASVAAEELVDANGAALDAKATPFVRQHIDLASGKTYYSPAVGPIQTFVDSNGQLTNAAKTPGAVGGGGAQPASVLNSRAAGFDEQGRPIFSSVADMAAGKPGVTGQGKGSAFFPNVSTSQQPGQLPTTTVSAKRTAGGAPSPINKGGGGGIPAVEGGNVDPVTKRKYEDWAGGGPVPTGKDLTAVQSYAAKNNLPTPTALSATGQQNVQAVDSVFREIDDALKTLDDIKDKPNLAIEYQKYKNLGMATPYSGLFTKLSFEGLRSAAAALKGNNSRAYPIIEKAFEHVPNLDRWHGLNPDSIELMKDKLKTMRQILNDTKETVMQDERKSGVIPAVQGAAAASTGEPTLDEINAEVERRRKAKGK